MSYESELIAGRGFTSHEYLPWFDLYNMNGRLYDPIVGRFFSPDNDVQMPDFSQSYNRYSYALNNPLIYTDPDGENPIAWIVAGIIILAKNYSDGIKANNGQKNPFKWDWSKAFFCIGNSSTLDGSSSTWHLGIGWSPEMLPSVGYNNNDGIGVGYSNPNGANLDYPGKKKTSHEEQVNIKINEVRQAYGQAWMDASSSGGSYSVKTYTIYGQNYHISNVIDGSGGIRRENGNISYMFEDGRLYTGQKIISHIVNNNVTRNASLKNIFNNNAINKEVYIGPYNGIYNGFGQGTSLGTRYGHIEGIMGTLDYLDWMQNNPEEVLKMQQQWYEYLKKISN